MDVVRRIESVGSKSGKCAKEVSVMDSGELDSELVEDVTVRTQPESRVTGSHRVTGVKGQGSRVKGQSWVKFQWSRVKGQGSRVKGQVSVVKGQGSRVRDHGSGVKGQGLRVRDHGSGAKGQGVKGQSSGVKFQGLRVKVQGSKIKGEL